MTNYKTDKSILRKILVIRKQLDRLIHKSILILSCVFILPIL
jgi:hypothetical protein